MAKFLQWNVRGVSSNWEELSTLINEHCPDVIALQETKSNSDFKLKGFDCYHTKINPNPSVGGVSLLVNCSLVSSEVNLQTDLEAKAVKISIGNKTYTVCSVYLSPSENYTKTSIENLLDQLPRPAILMGDFNAHNPLWGSASRDTRGKDLEEIFDLLNLCVLNDGTHTRLDSRVIRGRVNNTTSALDLTVVDPSVVLDFNWAVLDDTHGSDHYPILLTSTTTDGEDVPERFNLNKAKWPEFEENCRGRIKDETIFASDSCPVESFTRILTDIANDCIPKTSLRNRRTKVPWFNDECRVAKKTRKCALRRFRQAPTLANMIAFRRARARCRFVMKNAKRASWREFCSTLNSKAKASTVWRAIRRIKGKRGGPSLQHLDAGGTTLTNKKDIANLLASTLERNSSIEKLNPIFKTVKGQAERRPLDFSSDGSEEYNLPFTMYELREALRRSGDTAAGLDNVHYQFLKHLPDTCLNILLKVYNHVWESGNFPPSWREALIIPIPKPGKDSTNPNNYRPIALTSCLCKTMERMVNTRLNYCLENEHLLSSKQCGFRKGRSTTDQLVRFETFIREAFAEKKHVVSIFFDLEKAYDTTWKRGILNNLHEIGFRGRLANFVEGFLEHRTFTVRAGSTYSDTHEQHMGVPQGSILSPALFNIQINNIVKAATKNTECSLFVDDFAICIGAKSLHAAERQLQLCVNKVQEWVTKNGFKFSETKSVAMHFWNGQQIKDPTIYLNGTLIKAVEEARFLGLIFDRRLTFHSHIKDLKLRCLKSLDVLKVVGHTDWGADRKVLLQLYQALVRSKLDYGSVIYGSASKTNLQKLNTIHHSGLRIALGAFRTSPIQSMYTEACETSLHLRRLKLSLNYVSKLKSMPDNPAYDCVFNPSSKVREYFEAHPTVTKPLSLRVEPHLDAAKISLEKIEVSEPPLTPPWILETPEVFLGLSDFDKSTTSDVVYQHLFNEYSSNFSDYVKIFTDGSKSSEAVGAASVTGPDFKKVFKTRLPSCSSIYSAELHALILAMKMINQSQRDNFLVLSDSLSALIAIKEKKLDHPYLQDFFEWFHFLQGEGKKIVLAWVPSHVGIRGNCAADSAAKEALELEESEDKKIRFSDLKTNVNEYIKQQWQEEWDKEVDSKLYKVQPDRTDSLPCICGNRKEETVLTRLHIGHSYFTSSHLLKGEEKPLCIGCDEDLTIEHILLKCWDFYDIRRKHYSAENFKILFRDVPPDRIFDFLKEIGIFYKI